MESVVQFVSRRRYEFGVDIGTGTGFTAFAAAPYVRHIIASDITPAMLSEARRLAKSRNLNNLNYILAAAENLPILDNSLELVTCRTAAHHFLDIKVSVKEWYRVLSKDGVLILADTISPENPEITDWMNHVELIRDPSHKRDLTKTEWIKLIQTNGFSITDLEVTVVPMGFEDWVRRSGTQEKEIDYLEDLFIKASPDIKKSFKITGSKRLNIFFQWECIVIRAEPL